MCVQSVTLALPGGGGEKFGIGAGRTADGQGGRGRADPRGGRGGGGE